MITRSVITKNILLAAGFTLAAFSAFSAEPVCKATVHDPESYDYTDECYYSGTSLLQTYSLYRNTGSNRDYMAEKLTAGTNQSFSNFGNAVDLEYQWKGNNHLTLVQQFGGGIDTITFDYDGKGTTVLMERSPD